MSTALGHFSGMLRFPGRGRAPRGLLIALALLAAGLASLPLLSAPGFDHAKTGYPLEGLHAGLGCDSCHLDPVFSRVGNRCADCHADIHRRQLGRDCAECHTVRGWRRVTQNAGGHLNRFPLIGAHARTECESCHTGGAVGLFRGLDTACVSCHLEEYRAAAVNHESAGFSTECESCHGMQNWGAASGHAGLTAFPLTGAHASLDCGRCHAGGDYGGLTGDCVSCHTNDFNGAANPNHVTAGFPGDCTVCHGTSAWAPARYDHPAFPITSGAHAGKWSACGDCHTGSANYSLFTCLTCHEHERTSMDEEHGGVSGYVYNSSNCYACHPDGRE